MYQGEVMKLEDLTIEEVSLPPPGNPNITNHWYLCRICKVPISLTYYGPAGWHIDMETVEGHWKLKHPLEYQCMLVD